MILVVYQCEYAGNCVAAGGPAAGTLLAGAILLGWCLIASCWCCAVACVLQPEALRLALLLRADATPLGTPMQRMTFYLMQALAKRSEGCLGDEYVNEPPQTEQVRGQ